MASGPGPSAAPSTMRLEQAVALSYEARWLVDLRGRVMHASPAVHMLIGKSFAECSGRNMAELLLLPAAQAAQIEQCVANGTPFVDRVRLLVGESPFQVLGAPTKRRTVPAWPCSLRCCSSPSRSPWPLPTPEIRIQGEMGSRPRVGEWWTHLLSMRPRARARGESPDARHGSEPRSLSALCRTLVLRR